MKYLYVFFLLAPFLMACNSSKTNGESEVADTEMSTEDFMPESSMRVQSLVDMPGAYVSLDTLTGLCAPDTFVMWISYQDRDFMTNVRGTADEPSDLLTMSGQNKLKNKQLFALTRADFYPAAILLDCGFDNKPEAKAFADSIRNKSIKAMHDVTADFFLSQGMTKYMTRDLAAKWNKMIESAQADLHITPNPFNHEIVEFDTSSLSVVVTDPAAGIVEVEVYSVDPYTLGYPGWSYWTVHLAREHGSFKLCDIPSLHRRFEYVTFSSDGAAAE